MHQRQRQLNHFCSYEAIRSLSRFAFGTHAKANVQQLPTDLPNVLARVVDNDNDTDNRTCAMNCLNNMTVLPVSVLADSEAVACALRVIQEQGTGAQPVALATLCVPATHSLLHL